MEAPRPRSLDPERIESVFSTDRFKTGKLITFCGFDGAGKTTQISALCLYLSNKGYDVLMTRQPTDWYRQDKQVRLFLESGEGAYKVKTIALLAAADRLRHVADIINPALESGKIVLCDRYVYDTFVLFTSRGMDTDFLVRINSKVPRPDLAFYIDVPTADLILRLKNRDGKLKYEERNQKSIDNIKSRYDLLKCMFTVVNGANHLSTVTSEIQQITDQAILR